MSRLFPRHRILGQALPFDRIHHIYFGYGWALFTWGDEVFAHFDILGWRWANRKFHNCTASGVY